VIAEAQPARGVSTPAVPFTPFELDDSILSRIPRRHAKAVWAVIW